jgi:hypothetical protein
MGISHENLLHDIESEFPNEVRELEAYKNTEPAVKEEYLYELCEGNEGLTELLEEMLEYFYRYTRDVCMMKSLIAEENGIQEHQEEIHERDRARTALHNTMIDSVNILVRNLREKGKDVAWFDTVDKPNRSWYARLALLTTFLDIEKAHNAH